MPVNSELGRLSRHLVAPVVVLVTERGWLPAAMQTDLIEAGTILVSVILVYVVSWWRDQNKLREG